MTTRRNLFARLRGAASSRLAMPFMRGMIGLRGRFEGQATPDVDYGGLALRYATNRSFADIGCMWRLDGSLAFRAEEAGATQVTAFDAMEPSERFLEEHRRRGSSVRFVRGDLTIPERRRRSACTT